MQVLKSSVPPSNPTTAPSNPTSAPPSNPTSAPANPTSPPPANPTSAPEHPVVQADTPKWRVLSGVLGAASGMAVVGGAITGYVYLRKIIKL